MVHAVTYSRICCWVRLPRIMQQRLPILQDGTNSALFRRCTMSILLWSSLSPCLVAADVVYSSAWTAATVHRLSVPSDPKAHTELPFCVSLPPICNTPWDLQLTVLANIRLSAHMHACLRELLCGSSERLSHRRAALSATAPFGSASVLTFSTALSMSHGTA